MRRTAHEVSELMKKIKSSGSGIERRLRSSLRQKGYHFRVNDRTIFGKPDISFMYYKIAIFIDSEFWHGKEFSKEKFRNQKKKIYWYKKISRNMRRDKMVNKILRESGWIVLRFWGKRIERDLYGCLNAVEKTWTNRYISYVADGKRVYAMPKLLLRELSSGYSKSNAL